MQIPQKNPVEVEIMVYPQKHVQVEIPEKMAPIVEKLSSLYESALRLPDARGLESCVHEGLKDPDREMMELCIQSKASQCIEEEVQAVMCPYCEQNWSTLLSPSEPRYVITLRGKVDYERPVYRCTKGNCRRERAPFDEELGVDPKEHFTPLVQKKAVRAGITNGSFEKAHDEMVYQAEIPMSSKEIQRTVDKVGNVAVELENKEIYARGRPASPERPSPVAKHPETLVLEMDGTCVMGRDGQGHEVKCATAFGLEDRDTKGPKERPALTDRLYCATDKGIKPFGSMVWAMCLYWGIRTAKRLVVVGDGIDWIWNYVGERFYFKNPDGSTEKPIEILDFYHAVENLSKARDVIFKDPEGKRAKQWQDEWRSRILNGEVESLIEELGKRVKKARGKKARKELELRINYFEKHKDRMRYPEYEAAGYPIGSGAIEGTCKNLVKGRMSCVGQRWDSEKGIKRMLSLRVRLFNKRLDDLWDPDYLQKVA